METKIIGKKISEARKSLQLSQAQIADALCISPQAVGKWERGESLPDFIQFTKLAKLLGLDLNYFTEEFPSNFSLQTVANHSKDEVVKVSSPSWDFSKGNWKDADFSKATSIGEKLAGSNLNNCLFDEADLSKVHFTGNFVQQCSFVQSNLMAAQFSKCHLTKNDFSFAQLQQAEFTGTYLAESIFINSNLNQVRFKDGGWDKITLKDTAFHDVEFKNMYIGNTVFSGEIANCSFDLCAFKKVSFENATLTNTFFKCKSLKKISFKQVKMDRMTYAFLKNGGADLSGIEIL